MKWTDLTSRSKRSDGAVVTKRPPGEFSVSRGIWWMACYPNGLAMEEQSGDYSYTREFSSRKAAKEALDNEQL